MFREYVLYEHYRNLKRLILIMCLFLTAAQAHGDEENPLERLGDHTGNYFSVCFLSGEKSINQCLNDTFEDCMTYVKGYARSDRPCINNSRFSSVSYLEQYLEKTSSSINDADIAYLSNLGGDFCQGIFSVQPEGNIGARIDHCLYAVTELMFQYLDNKIRRF